jgi:hypothetical protein
LGRRSYSRGGSAVAAGFEAGAPEAGVAADPDAGGVFEAAGAAEALEVAVVTLDFEYLQPVRHTPPPLPLG